MIRRKPFNAAGNRWSTIKTGDGRRKPGSVSVLTRLKRENMNSARNPEKARKNQTKLPITPSLPERN